MAACADDLSAAMAADNVVHLPFPPVITEATRSGTLDDSVRFYLAGH
ncbi:hypothetical protein [Dyella silvatica]|nr:hypothetical protein [Dyella silvatica]